MEVVIPSTLRRARPNAGRRVTRHTFTATQNQLVRARAPLRLGLAGGGTDVSPFPEAFGGSVLNATIALYSHATIAPRSDGKICFIAADRNETSEHPATPEIPLDPNMALHEACYNRLVREFNAGAPLPITLTTWSDVQAGSGLGSSSTLVVAILHAFREYLQVAISDYDIAELACVIEREDVALAGGMQDQYAATFGGFNFIEFFGNGRVIVNQLRISPAVVAELEARLILCYTGLSRDSSSIIRSQTANLVAGNSSAVGALKALKRDAERMKDHLLRGNLTAFAEVLGRSWETKKSLASLISNETVENVYDIARAAGACAGKVSGAGGGGFMMFMLEPTRRPQVAEALQSAGFKVMPFSFTDQRAHAWRPS